MALDVVGLDVMIVAEVAVLGAALVLSVIAALGFWDAPFGRLLKPLPLVLLAFLVMDAGTLLSADLPRTYFHGVGAIAVFIAAYAAIQGALLLTERRGV